MSMMDCYRKPPKKHPGRFGIEIETEAMGEYEQPALKFWKTEFDGSLRHFGIEYILKAPKNLDAVGLALDEFFDFYESVKEDVEFIEDTHSTSIHVHLNMQNEEPIVLANYLTLWTMFEEVLLSLCGDDRRDNLFCLSNTVAGGLSRIWHKFLSDFCAGDWGATEYLDINVLKYSSLNIAPLKVQGSIEVRTMEGTYDKERILMWITVLDDLFEAAKRDWNPTLILADYKHRQEDLFFDVFKRSAGYIMSYVEDSLKEKIDKNLWFVRTLSVVTSDWGSMNTALPQKVKEWREKTGSPSQVFLSAISTPFPPTPDEFFEELVDELPDDDFDIGDDDD